MKPNISILIPTTFGGLNYLTKLMPALAQEASENNAEIIVVDNNSKDGTANYLSNYDCTVKFNKVNLGFAKAHNQAAKIAQGNYLLLLNNDTAVYPGFISGLLKTIKSAPKIGIVGCLIYLMDNTKKIQHAGIMFTDTGMPYELGMEVAGFAPAIAYNDPRVRAVREVPAVTGACMLIDRQCWDEINGFDEGYLNGWEDTPLCLAAREKGWKIYYNGEVYIKHKRFGSVHAGRLQNEAANRNRYEAQWVTTGRALKVLKGFLNG